MKVKDLIQERESENGERGGLRRMVFVNGRVVLWGVA